MNAAAAAPSRDRHLPTEEGRKVGKEGTTREEKEVAGKREVTARRMEIEKWGKRGAGRRAQWRERRERANEETATVPRAESETAGKEGERGAERRVVRETESAVSSGWVWGQ